MCEDASSQPAKALTGRQKSVVRAYFASGCSTWRTAKGLGVSTRYIREVKALPAARLYLDHIEAQAIDTLVKARAAQMLEPMLH